MSRMPGPAFHAGSITGEKDEPGKTITVFRNTLFLYHRFGTIQGPAVAP
jgi:hypothetical protein